MGKSRVEAKVKDKAEELSGKLSLHDVEDKLMHSVLENDKETISDGKLISEAINQGIGSFVPDMIYEQLVKDYRLTERIYGDAIIRELTGYDPDFIEKNINVPEFRKEIKEKIKKKVKDLKKKKYIDTEGITDLGLKLASLVMYTQELDHLVLRGYHGSKEYKKDFLYGERKNIRAFRKGDRYRDIAIRKTLKTATRRSRSAITAEDLRVSERKNKGAVNIIYAIDASGSMKGKKIETAKKAGISLAFNAITNRDKVGLVVFGSEIDKSIKPTNDFVKILREIVSIRSSGQTDLAKMITNASTLFPEGNATKHLIILSDALPTVGGDPENHTLKACSLARNNNITISVAGIKLSKEGRKLAEEMTTMCSGKLYNVKDLENVDRIILEDYYSYA